MTIGPGNPKDIKLNDYMFACSVILCYMVYYVAWENEGGGRWRGSGYGQGNLARLIHDFTKGAVLDTNFDDCRDVVLVGLALFWWSASIPKQLNGHAKSAAFQWCEPLEKPSVEDEDFTMDLHWTEVLLLLSPS